MFIFLIQTIKQNTFFLFASKVRREKKLTINNKGSTIQDVKCKNETKYMK